MTDRIVATYKAGQPRPEESRDDGAMRTPRAAASIVRSRSVFTFDGQRYSGLASDTLASALIANGVHLVGRSFKYHRPRGFLAAGAEEPNALVDVDRGGGRSTPNLRATQVELYEGLVARSQNRWPSLDFDIGEINDLVPPASSAPVSTTRPSWRRPRPGRASTSPSSARAAGLGVAPTAPDPDHYAQQYAFCDVLVVGAGAAGLAAALAAAETGASVILADEQAEMGGGLLDEARRRDRRRAAPDWLARRCRALAAMANVTLLPRTQAFGYFAQNFLGLAERVTDHLAAPLAEAPRERLWKVRAGRRRAGHRRDRAAAGVSGQRSAGRHARWRRAHLPQPLWRQGRATRRGHIAADDSGYARGARPASRRGWKSRRSPIMRATPRALAMAARAAGLRGRCRRPS